MFASEICWTARRHLNFSVVTFSGAWHWSVCDIQQQMNTWKRWKSYKCPDEVIWVLEKTIILDCKIDLALLLPATMRTARWGNAHYCRIQDAWVLAMALSHSLCDFGQATSPTPSPFPPSCLHWKKMNLKISDKLSIKKPLSLTHSGFSAFIQIFGEKFKEKKFLFAEMLLLFPFYEISTSVLSFGKSELLLSLSYFFTEFHKLILSMHTHHRKHLQSMG